MQNGTGCHRKIPNACQIQNYFQAVDGLLNDSPWAAPKTDPKDPKAPAAHSPSAPGGPLVFHSREQIVAYMDELLRHKQFHRAKKIPVLDTKKKSAKKEAKTDTSEVSTKQPNI